MAVSRKTATGALAAGGLLALAAIVIFPPDRSSSRDALAPPGYAHWLGTNDIGQDVAAGLILGLSNTVLIPVAVATLSLLIAGGLAAIAAWRGGLAEAMVLRLVEVLQILPSMFLLLLLASWIRPGFAGIMLLLALTSWHDDVRVLRAILLREIPRENVQYARLHGAGWFYCLRRHVLPAVWPAVLAVWVQNVQGGVMRIAGLGFLGLIDPRLVTWGGMMQEALPWLYGPAWLWLLLPPALSLSLFVAMLILAAKRLEERALAAGVAP
ncbi:MAG: ABC transporter permease subunit [Geminicoccaceae bacterium]